LALGCWRTMLPQKVAKGADVLLQSAIGHEGAVSALAFLPGIAEGEGCVYRVGPCATPRRGSQRHPLFWGRTGRGGRCCGSPRFIA